MEKQTSEYFGYELIIDVAGCVKEAITSPAHIAAFSVSLVEALDMEAYGSPQVLHFGKDDKAGWTLVQLITTSNIVAHFNDNNCTGYLNIFSCKPYKQEVAEQVIRDFFAPKRLRSTFLVRQADSI